MAATEQVQQVVEPVAQRRSRRPLVTAVVLVLALVLGAVWWRGSIPRIAEGNVLGPAVGMERMSDPVEQTKWLKTAEVGQLTYTLYNDGPVDLTLRADYSGQDFDGFVGPHVYVAFAPADDRLTPLTSTAWADLLQSVVIPSGGQAWVVMSVAYPMTCQAPLKNASGWYFFRNANLLATALGRTSQVAVPLTYPVYVPNPSNGGCGPEDFDSLDAAFPRS